VQASKDVRSVLNRVRRRILSASDIGELSPSQATVLGLLADGDGVSVSDLAATERVRHQSMTATITALLGRGLVARRADPEDGRRLLIFLTADGRRQVTQGRQARTEWLAGRLQNSCTPAELEAIISAMAILDRATSG
jgi:DNA-binding MarR family transcriptional regulator